MTLTEYVSGPDIPLDVRTSTEVQKLEDFFSDALGDGLSVFPDVKLDILSYRSEQAWEDFFVALQEDGMPIEQIVFMCKPYLNLLSASGYGLEKRTERLIYEGISKGCVS